MITFLISIFAGVSVFIIFQFAKFLSMIYAINIVYFHKYLVSEKKKKKNINTVSLLKKLK